MESSLDTSEGVEAASAPRPSTGPPPQTARWLGLGFLAPGSLVLGLLFLVPLVLVFVYSFEPIDIVGLPRPGFTWLNYNQSLQPYYIPTLVRTVEYSALTTAICLVLAYPLAYLATRFAPRFGRFILIAIIMTWLVDYLVRIYAWTVLLGYDGVVNQVLVTLGFGRQPFIPSTVAVIAGLVYGYFPLMVLPIYSALGDLDTTLIDAGKDLYGNSAQTFLHVTLPSTLPGIVGGVIITFFPALGDFATAQFLGGPGQTMIGNLISEQFTQSGSIPFGAALTVLLLVVLLIGLAAAVLISRRGMAFAMGTTARSAFVSRSAAG